jgi:hypothetical protein
MDARSCQHCAIRAVRLKQRNKNGDTQRLQKGVARQSCKATKKAAPDKDL